MRKNNASQILGKIIVFSFVIAISVLISLVVPKSYGIAISIVFAAIALFCLFTEKHFNILQKRIDNSMPLLLSIVVFIGTIASAFMTGGRYTFFFLCCSLAGLSGIVKWFVEKRYEGKSIVSIVKDDIHLLPSDVDVAIVVLNTLDIAFGKGEMSLCAIIINIVLLSDAIFQIFMKRISGNQTKNKC